MKLSLVPCFVLSSFMAVPASLKQRSRGDQTFTDRLRCADGLLGRLVICDNITINRQPCTFSIEYIAGLSNIKS